MFYHTSDFVTFANGVTITRDWQGYLWGLYPMWLPIRPILAFPFFAQYPDWLVARLSESLAMWQGVN